MKCTRCKALAEVQLQSHHSGFCRECFQIYFVRQIARAIKDRRMIRPGDKILVALSGGKDSLGLMLALKELAPDLGFELTGLHIDLGIPGSSAFARAKVEEFCERFSFPLRVVEMEKEGLPIPLVKERIRRPICSACGQIKRHWFNRTAVEQGFNVLATGHNLDDEVSRLFANTLRWDAAYLSDLGPDLAEEGLFARKIKPLYRVSEFETACWCFFKGIEPWSAPCPYSAGASFTVYKKLWEELEATMRGSKIRFYESFLKSGRPAFEAMARQREVSGEDGGLGSCVSCGYPTGAGECGVCRLKRLVAEGGTESPAEGEGGEA